MKRRILQMIMFLLLLSSSLFAQVHHFVIRAQGGGIIVSQVAGTTLFVEILAEDSINSIVADFNGTVIVSSNGSLLLGEGTTPGFVHGVLSNYPIAISNTGAFSLSATDPLSGRTGSSNVFAVGPGIAESIEPETLPDGSGSLVGPETLSSGNSVTLYAVARDSFGNFVGNIGASWSLLNVSGGVANGDLVSNPNTKSAVFTGHVLGSAQVQSTSGGLTSTPSNTLTVIPGAASKLAFVQEPTNTVAGTAISPSLTIQEQDASGNAVALAGTAVSISKSSGSGVLSGTLVQSTNTSGVAIFNDLTLDTAGSKVLLAAAAGLASATSTSFTINASSPTKLAFTTEPGNGIAGAVLSPSPAIQLRDAFGNNAQVSGTSINITLNGTGTLSGTRPVSTNTSGTASFPDLRVDSAGTKTLTASAAGLTSATSNAFILSALTITASAIGNGTISPSGTLSYPEGANQTFTIAPSAGFHIDSVVVDGSNQGALGSYPFVNISANHVIAAYFSINRFTITATSGLHGTILPAGSIVVDFGSDQTFSLTPDLGYHVQSVVIDGSTQQTNQTSYTFINVTANHTIVANFVADTLAVIVRTFPDGLSMTVDGIQYTSPHTFSWAANAAHTISAQDSITLSGTRYIWSNWSDAGAITHSVTPLINTTYLASYHLRYLLTTNANPVGTVIPQSGWQDSGAVISLSALASTGYHLLQWRGAGTGSYTGPNPTPSVTMNSPVFDTAYFALDTLTINASAGAHGTISPLGSVPVPYGSNQSFTITPAPLYHISDLVVDGVSVPGAPGNYTFTSVTANHSIQASFTINGYTITGTSGPNGNITPSGPVSVNGGDSLVFTMTPNSGYRIDTVKVDGAAIPSPTSSYSFTNIQSNHTIAVVFAPLSLAITVRTSPDSLGFSADGINYTSPHTFSWLTGSSHTLSTASPQNGTTGTRYVWSNWSDSGAQSHTYIPSRTDTVTVNFGTEYFLNMGTSPGGSVTPASGWFAKSQQVTITALPDTLYDFTHWNGTGDGSTNSSTNPDLVTVNGPVTETANFARKPLQVTVRSVPPSTKFIVNGNTIQGVTAFALPYGQTISIDAISPQLDTSLTPNIQYVWKNWSNGGPSYQQPTIYTDTTFVITYGKQFTLTTAAGTGGTVQPATGWQDSGQTVTLVATPDPGYSFVEWRGAGNGSYSGNNDTALVTMNQPIFDTATFTQHPINVTVQTNPPGRQFLVDGRLDSNSAQYVWVYGTTHTITVPDTQSGGSGTRYLFTNWSDGGAKSHTTVATQDSTFTVNFETQYFLTMTAGIGGGVTPSSGWHTKGQTVPITASPNATFHFGGWNGTGTGSYTGPRSDTTARMDGPITETASFFVIPIHVTLQTVPPGRSFIVDSVLYSGTQAFIWNINSTHQLSVSTPQSGPSGTQYVWRNWSDGGSMSHSVSVVADTTFAVHFGTQFYLAMQSDSGGSTNPTSGWQDSGRAVPISAIANPGFQFLRWVGTAPALPSDTSNPASTTVNEPDTMRATFTRFATQVVVQSNPAGLQIIVDGTSYTSPHTFSWLSGTLHSIGTGDTIGGSAGTRYLWSSWSDGKARAHSVAAVHDTTFTAVFSTQYFLTMNANVGGIVSPSSGWFSRGSQVTISAYPAERYNFSIWSGIGAGSYSLTENPTVITMNGPITETASFVRKQITITIRTNPPGRSFSYDFVTYTDPQTRTIDPGTLHYLDLPSPQNAGLGAQYVWRSWSDGGTAYHTVTPDSDQTFIANFGRQFYLTTAAGIGGTVQPNSGWQDSGKSVTLTAIPDARFALLRWAGYGNGAYTGANNPATIQMNAPITDSAYFTGAVLVTVTSLPVGRRVTVDDSTYSTPKTFNWISGTTHNLSAATPEIDSLGVRHLWMNWSDSGAITHTVIARNDTTFIATFLTQYYLTMNPRPGGNALPASAWYDQGSALTIRAIPDSGYGFVSWSGTGNGSYTGDHNPASIVLNGPITEQVSFGLLLPPPDLTGLQNDTIDVSTSPLLSWNPYAGATSYKIQVSADSTFADPARLLIDSSGTMTSVQLTMLANLRQYYWRVIVRVGSDIAYSPIRRFTTISATLQIATPLAAWGTGYTYPITWTSVNLSGPVNIKISSDGGGTFTKIKSAIPNMGSTSWSLPDTTLFISTSCKLRVESTLNDSIYRETGLFAIVSGRLPASVTLSTTLPFAADPKNSTDYRLFSQPGRVDTIPFKAFFTGAQKVDWRAFADNGMPENYLVELGGSTRFTTGTGYWLLKKGNLVIPSYTMPMPQLSSDATYSIPIHDGWNLIGNPFDKTVSWQSVIDRNSLPLATQLYTYEGAYTTADRLTPFKGYYYFNTDSLRTSLKISYPFGGTTAQAARQTFDWRVQIAFESDINVDAENFAGISQATRNRGVNSHKPPLFLDQGFLYFPHPEWDSRYSRFNADYRESLGEGQVWNFEVSNPRKGTGTLRFTDLSSVPAGSEIVLISMYNNTPVDLRTKTEYTFEMVSAKMPFKLLIGSKEFVKKETAALVPQVYELMQNFPNPFNPSTSISFAVPRDANIRIDIYSILGQKVATVAEGAYTAGVHTVVWDGTRNGGEHAASGVYFYQLSESGSVLLTKKMILLK